MPRSDAEQLFSPCTKPEALKHIIRDASPRAPVVSGGLAFAVKGYKESDNWKIGLKLGTRNSRRPMLDEVAQMYEFGEAKQLRKEHIEKDLSRFADAVRKTILECTENLAHINDCDVENGNARLVFAGMKDDGTPRHVMMWRRGNVSGGMGMSYSVYDAGYLIYRIILSYAYFWATDLKKGEAN